MISLEKQQWNHANSTEYIYVWQKKFQYPNKNRRNLHIERYQKKDTLIVLKMIFDISKISTYEINQDCRLLYRWTLRCSFRWASSCIHWCSHQPLTEELKSPLCSLTRGQQAFTVTWVSETLQRLLVRWAHICISTSTSTYYNP